MIHLIVSLVLVLIAVKLVLRIVFAPLRFGGYRRRGYGYGSGRGYGGGRLLPLLGLLALGRLFGRRW